MQIPSPSAPLGVRNDKGELEGGEDVLWFWADSVVGVGFGEGDGAGDVVGGVSGGFDDEGGG